MATNSKREQILVYHTKYLIGKVKSISHVVRVMPDYAGLQNFAVTQFPLAAVVGRLPIPKEKKSSRDGSGVDLILSLLSIDNYIYLQERENPDTVMSNIMDDVWTKCYSDVTYGGLVISTILKVNKEPEYWEPFVAFKLTSEVVYQHTTGGI
jgi:hypothetical protein